FIGLAITEPIGCNHTYAAIFGLLLGCMAEVASIIGHCAYVKYDVEFKPGNALPKGMVTYQPILFAPPKPKED
ncbi:MAG: hypothetical protein J6P39_06475, partial [Oscillospiraceae bacterium]|nr:hypothetical protein [Oscillospiraceae bacterium]